MYLEAGRTRTSESISLLWQRTVPTPISFDVLLFPRFLEMKLHFLGANRQVTGSRYCLEAAGKEILIDCGMFQERMFQPRNWDVCPIPPAEIDAVLLTHAHIDHIGLLPRFVNQGFRGPIFATRPTAALLETMLRDSAKIQQEDASYKKKRQAKQHHKVQRKHPVEPLYTDDDVSQVLPSVQGWQYHKPLELFPGISAKFYDAGHILGSASIELTVTEEEVTRKIVFSGDIGKTDKPIIRDPEMLTEADYVVMETTYGDRAHELAGDVESQLAEIWNQTKANGGNLIIPTFALERAQELMYHFARLAQSGRIEPPTIFMDSPMAVDVTEIFARFPDCYDAEMSELIATGTAPLKFPGLQMVRTAEESKRINSFSRPCIIMASSGMCNAGRIKHHLKQNIERPQSTILFVGYQSDGTLGRQILQGSARVRIHGEEYRVRANIAQVYGASGHADKNGLWRWLTNFEKSPRQIFLTHGEEDVALAFADRIRKELNWPVHVPHYREMVDLV